MNKTTITCMLAICLLCSCAVQKICPAYHTAFVLDEDEQEKMYSLFTVVEGDTVPKRPYGFKYEADGDSLMDKFLKGTPGRGFRVQGGRVHSYEKAGFTYENRKKEPLLARVFRGKEKPVLENPYLFDRLTKKRPYYKMDQLEMKLIHFNRPKYDSLLKARIDKLDSGRYDALMAEMEIVPLYMRDQFAPLLSRGFNVEQEEYNKRFKEYFPKESDFEPEIDTLSLQDFMADTALVDTTAKKRRLLGIFKKKNRADKPKKERKRKAKKNNEEGTKGEDNQ
ncbi:hypothetical protein [Roseivirga sp.]|uniref:hypothetical protein n=1 Tax=Roseivirga sp. TaxID=1964215 RepID=UPI003B8D5D3F